MPLLQDGKDYDFKGQKIRLYPISRLCAELSNIGYYRSEQTIRKWEKFRVTPKAMFRCGEKRLYSQEQIDAYCEVIKNCNIKQGFSLAESDFSEKIWAKLTEVNKELEERFDANN